MRKDRILKWFLSKNLVIIYKSLYDRPAKCHISSIYHAPVGSKNVYLLSKVQRTVAKAAKAAGFDFLKLYFLIFPFINDLGTRGHNLGLSSHIDY